MLRKLGSTPFIPVLIFTFATAATAQITIDKPIPQTATIEIHAGQPGPSIPRTVFGTFLEPIGNSTYNGLWAEILENPSLESGLWSPGRVEAMLQDRPELRRAGEIGLPLPWEPLDPGQGNRYLVHRGEAANSWQSLQVFAVPGEPTGIRQRVYLPVHRCLRYTGSFYARHLSGDTSVAISIRRRGGEVLATQTIELPESQWTRHEFSLEIPPGKLHRLEPADFVVQLSGNERADFDEFSLDPADAVSGLDPDALQLAREMKTPLVRFGGNFTSSYNWRNGIGPREHRISMMNSAWGIPEYNTFGTDEFLEFCRLIGAQPQVALNLGSGTPQEAADWVRYIDDHWTTHSGLLWELGNELWGNWNLAYPTQAELAARTAAFSQAIRAVDPQARLIATGGDPEWFSGWNATQLTNPAGTFDYLSTHFVTVTDETVLANPAPDFVQSASFALPAELERRLHDAQHQIDQTAAFSGKAHLAFTEWLFPGHHPGSPSFSNLGGAVIAGSFLNMILRNADMVPISDMTGIMEFAGIWKKRSQVYATPAYYAFRMYSGADIARTVPVTSDSGAYSVSHGVKRLPDIANVLYLDITAAISSDRRTLTIFCVNRSLSVDIPASIRMPGFRPAGSADIHLLSGSRLTLANDELHPELIVPAESSEKVVPGQWTHLFPHESVTVIALHGSAE